MGGFSRAKSCMELSSAEAVQPTKLKTVPSNLFLPAAEGEEQERLFLPNNCSGQADIALDEYLSRIPRVVSRAEELHRGDGMEEVEPNFRTTAAARPTNSREYEFLRRANSGRCLNVLQGEVAHASTLQTDVIVSAEATTCHVVALRSTKSASVPLVSLAHVDKAGAYDHCLEAMVQEHVKHHRDQQKQQQNTGTTQPIDPDNESDEDFFFFEHDEQPDEVVPTKFQGGEQERSFLPSAAMGMQRSSSMPIIRDMEPIEMELHMIGGYLDKDGTSRELSNSLITTFSHLADKYQDTLRISLSTAAISCLNTTTQEAPAAANAATCPKSRGLGIDAHTGEVFPIHSSLPKDLEGPGLEVRSARAFARLTEPSSSKSSSLHVIHDRTSHGVTVEPFHYQPIPAMNALLHVPDQVLLEYTSTSPDCESDRFCSDLRRTVSFVNTVDSRHVFGDDCQRPLVYTRSAHNLNEWAQQQQQQQVAAAAF